MHIKQDENEAKNHVPRHSKIDLSRNMREGTLKRVATGKYEASNVLLLMAKSDTESKY